MARGLSDPSWKSGPTYPEPTSSEHAIDPEPAGYDHDGVGRDEAERVDGAALCAVREAYSCSRDGCDVSPRRIHVYALSDVSDRLMKIARHAIDYTDDPEEGDFVEFFAVRAQVVDYDEGPILGFEVGDDTIGYVYPHFTDEHDFGGPCYGHVEPEPDINAHRYDL
jgi:hypothetical protein